MTKHSFKMSSLVLSCHITVVLKNNSNLSELLRAKQESGLICFLPFFKNLKVGDASAGFPLSVTWQKVQGLWDKSPHTEMKLRCFTRGWGRVRISVHAGAFGVETRSGMHSGELEYTVGPHEQLVRVSDVRREKNKHRESFKDRAYLFH